MSRFIEVSSGTQGGVTLTGDWVLDNLSAIRKEMKSRSLPGTAVRADIGQMDTAGAMVIDEIGGKNISGLKPWQQDLIQLATRGEKDFPKPDQVPQGLRAVLITTGKNSVQAWDTFLELVSFIGEATIGLGRSVTHPKDVRVKSIVRHIYETGVAAIPIVALIAFLISIVLAYQGAGQLKRFGADIFSIDLVAVSVLREMGVLLTAIMIAGRSGSAFTAEIGVMKVNEEVDAMQIIGVRPFDFLVLPRMLALIIAMPLLTFIADLMGLLGGAIICYFQMGIDFGQYADRARNAIGMWDFWVGMIKAPVFAIFIALIGCMRGLQVSGSAESVGRQTTTSVVQSIFVVLLLDALFSILFTKLGI